MKRPYFLDWHNVIVEFLHFHKVIKSELLDSLNTNRSG